MNLLNSHLTLSFDITFLKIYFKSGYYVVLTLGEEYNIQKSKSPVEVAAYVFNEIQGIPHTDLMFYYNKLAVSKNKKEKINQLIKKTTGETMTIAIIKKYIEMLF